MNHTLTTDPRVLHVYIPWLCAALAAALELEGVHRLRRLIFGVHPIPAALGWLLLCGAGMVGATALSYTLIYISHVLRTAAHGYCLPWLVCLTYLAIVAERERRAARASLPNADPEV